MEAACCLKDSVSCAADLGVSVLIIAYVLRYIRVDDGQLCLVNVERFITVMTALNKQHSAWHGHA